MSDRPDPTVNISWHVLVGTTITVALATLSVAGRFYARVKNKAAGLKLDDWLIFAALLVNLGMAAIRIYQVMKDGYGRHAVFLEREQVMDFQKSFLAVQITYFVDATLIKSSLLYMYYRIFGVSVKFTGVLWFSWGLVMAWFIACVIVAIAGCDPVSFFWNKNQAGGCINETQFFRWNGVSNMILDILVLVLPLAMVWRLQMGMRQKFALSAIFLLGLFVCVVSIFRITAFSRSRQTDPTFSTVDTAAWSSVEQSMGIVCACLPTLRPLFRFLGIGNPVSNKTSNSYTSNPFSSNRKDPPFEMNGSRRQRSKSDSTAGLADASDDASLKDEEMWIASRASQLDGLNGIIRTQEISQRSDTASWYQDRMSWIGAVENGKIRHT